MEINALNSYNGTFSGRHLLPKHVDWFKNLNPEEIEMHFHSIGLPASFEGQNVIAGLSFCAFRIARALRIPLPAEFGIRKTPKDAIAQSWFNRDRKPHVFLHRAVQYGRDSMFSSIKRFDKYMRSAKSQFGTSHFLNIPLHEILHCDLFKKIGDKYSYWHLEWDKVINKKFSKIDISPFEAEIKRKIGTYAATDAVELHAVYWAKEICKSLNSNLMPKYNPFETPKIELSPLLREFIDKITIADYNGAKEVSKRAKKLQKTV